MTVRTFHPRRGRMTRQQTEALATASSNPWLMTPASTEWNSMFASQTPIVLEIGFGMGDATVKQAEGDPTTCVLAVDVHTPGVGQLLAAINQRGLTNVRVVQADGNELLRDHIGTRSLAGIRAYFPDPWPKTRHHKRRLIRNDLVDVMVDRLIVDGFLHVATDDPGYAQQMLDVLSARADLDHPFDGFVPRGHSIVTDRPVTKFERRAQRVGRRVYDVYLTRTLNA